MRYERGRHVALFRIALSFYPPSLRVALPRARAGGG